MKLTWRFIVLIAALLASVAASATFGLRALNHLDRALDGVVTGDMERLLAITHTRRLFRSMVVLERDFLLSTSEAEQSAIERKLGTTNQELQVQVDKYARLMPTGDAAAVADIRAVRERWVELNARVLGAAKLRSPEALALSALHAKDPVSWENVIGGLVKANEQRLSHEVAGTHQTYLSARATLLTASALAALLAAGLGSVIFLGIRSNLQQVYELNASLEGKVHARTLALAEREQSLRLVLDSTGDGIVGVDASGKLAGNASAAASHWFGACTPGERAASYLFAGDPSGEGLFSLGLSQLQDDVMPWQVTVDQMPRRLLRGETILDLSYKLVPGDDKLALLVVARDVTARVHSEHAEQEARERQGLVAKLLLDKHGFSGFVRDAEHLLATLDSESEPQLALRALHTLKGNVAVYGLSTMARMCHKIEERLADSGGLPLELEVAGLKKHLRDNLRGIEDFLTSIGRDVYEVPSAEHAALVQCLVDRKDYPELLQMVEVWTWPRASERLSRLRGEAEYLARRLDKRLRVVVEHDDLRLPEGYLEQFWPTLTHVVRNALDHGIESPEERAQAGKPVEGRLRLRASLAGNELCLEIDDDGAGVDLPALRLVAERRGVVVQGDASDIDLIFHDGISTRGSATDISGRGVGLAATRAACEACGGSVTVHSETRGGTRFRFVFPRPLVDTAAIEARRERRWRLAPTARAGAGAASVTKLKLTPNGASKRAKL
jgi:two-component system chemotaxis sensor kinase CheA